MQSPITSNESAFAELTKPMLFTFAAVAAGWFALSAGACWFLQRHAFGSAMGWLVLLWGVSLVDLLALAKLISALLGIAAEGQEKRAGAAIRTFYWGTLKLACLGIFGYVLLKAGSSPGVSLVTGLGTLICVPLIGGFVWSQRVLRHA